MEYPNFNTEDRRLIILQLLSEQPGYTAGGSVLQSALKQYGHRVSRDLVRTDLTWLAEQGLVTVAVVADALHVPTLTQRGLDVADGTASTPGVKRPGPGS